MNITPLEKPKGAIVSEKIITASNENVTLRLVVSFEEKLDSHRNIASSPLSRAFVSVFQS